MLLPMEKYREKVSASYDISKYISLFTMPKSLIKLLGWISRSLAAAFQAKRNGKKFFFFQGETNYHNNNNNNNS